MLQLEQISLKLNRIPIDADLVDVLQVNETSELIKLLQTTEKQYMLELWVDCEGGIDRYMLLPISTSDLNMYKHNKITLYDLVTNCDQFIFIDYYEQPISYLVNGKDFPIDYLPGKNSYLNVK